MTTKKQLYQVKGKDEYGILLTTNSQGQLVLEMKGGSGTVAAFDKDEVEKVMPYTFSVRYVGTNRTYDYLGKAGVVEPGDMLVQEDGQCATVVSVDTKSARANKEFQGWKIPAVRLTSDDGDVLDDEETDY